MTQDAHRSTLAAVNSLRCVCGRVLTAETGEALLTEVERHLDELLVHARLIERGADLETHRETPIADEAKEET